MSDGGWVEGKFSYVIVGESVTFAHEWVGATNVSSPDSRVYFNRTDKTTDVMPAGSNTISGTIQVAPPVVALAIHAGGKYVLEFEATVDGNTLIKKVQLDVIGSGEEY